MKEYRKLMTVGGVLLILPFVRPFLAFTSKHGFMISSIGFVSVLLGLILMFAEKN